jgi:hypothetical protein
MQKSPTLTSVLHNRRRRRLTVAHPEGLARLLREVIDERYGGVQLRAARGSVSRQSQFSRLLRAKTPTIQVKTFEWLKRFVPPERRAELVASLLSPSVSDMVLAYHLWLGERGDRFPSRRGRRWRMTSRGIRKADGIPFTQRLKESEYLVQRLRQQPDLVSYFRSFERAAKARGHSGARINLAYIRVVEPLLEMRESGFVERGWEEMSPEDLRQFLEAGFTRERVLLNRSPDLQRAQEVFEREPRNFLEPEWRELLGEFRGVTLADIFRHSDVKDLAARARNLDHLNRLIRRRERHRSASTRSRNRGGESV